MERKRSRLKSRSLFAFYKQELLLTQKSYSQQVPFKRYRFPFLSVELNSSMVIAKVVVDEMRKASESKVISRCDLKTMKNRFVCLRDVCMMRGD